METKEKLYREFVVYPHDRVELLIRADRFLRIKIYEEICDFSDYCKDGYKDGD